MTIGFNVALFDFYFIYQDISSDMLLNMHSLLQISAASGGDWITVREIDAADKNVWSGLVSSRSWWFVSLLQWVWSLEEIYKWGQKMGICLEYW